MTFVFIVFFLLTPLLPVELDRTSLRVTEERDSKAAKQEEDVEPVEEKSPAKKPKRRSTQKLTAAAKEAREAKEAAAAVKATPGWATTFTLDGVQYVLQDAAGHPVSFFFYQFLLASHYFSSDRRE